MNGRLKEPGIKIRTGPASPTCLEKEIKGKVVESLEVPKPNSLKQMSSGVEKDK